MDSRRSRSTEPPGWGSSHNNMVMSPLLDGEDDFQRISSRDDSLSIASNYGGLTTAQFVRISVVMVAYALYYTLLAGNQTVASLAEEAIGPDRYATMPIIAMFAGALSVVVPASKFMERFGRRAGFFVGGLAGIASSALAFVSIKLKSFELFLLANFLLGVFDGFSDYLRFAASEIVSASFQGYAISLALSGGAVCSVLGPLLAQKAQHKGGWGAYYAIATAIGVLFCGVVLCVETPKPKPSTALSPSSPASARESTTSSSATTFTSAEGSAAPTSDTRNAVPRPQPPLPPQGAPGFHGGETTPLSASVLSPAAPSSSAAAMASEPVQAMRGSQDVWLAEEKRVSKVKALGDGSGVGGPNEEDSSHTGFSSDAAAQRATFASAASSSSASSSSAALSTKSGGRRAPGSEDGTNEREDDPSPPRRPLLTILRTPECSVAVLTGISSQFAMILLMTALPLGMVDNYDFKFDTYAETIQFHLLGMFIPGMFSGLIVDSVGVVSVLLAGTVLIGLSLFFGFIGVELWNFTSCLVVVGVGWNLMSIGSTKLLLQSHSGQEAHSVQAAYEFASFAANAGASFVAGWSISLEGGWRAVLVAAAPFTALSLVAVLLLACRGVRPHQIEGDEDPAQHQKRQRTRNLHQRLGTQDPSEIQPAGADRFPAGAGSGGVIRSGEGCGGGSYAPLPPDSTATAVGRVEPARSSHTGEPTSAVTSF